MAASAFCQRTGSTLAACFNNHRVSLNRILSDIRSARGGYQPDHLAKERQMKFHRIAFVLLLSIATHANAASQRMEFSEPASSNMTPQRIYQLATAKKDPAAMYALGSMLLAGYGVRQDSEEAFSWFFRAAEGGNNDAMNFLGVAYASGSEVPQNNTLALRWFLKAAGNGSVEAMNNVALAYRFGVGTPVDYPESAKWFGQAAAKGDAAAMNSLAVMYDKGMGVPENKPAAGMLLTQAAKLGYPLAMENLGALYANGEDVKRDNVVAYAWLGAALEAGLQEPERAETIQALDMLAEQLGAADLARARKLAERFTAAITRQPAAATSPHHRSSNSRNDSSTLKPSYL
jgi:TPR repeat protein